MIQILLLLICAATLSLLLNRKIHELLPLVLMAAILAVYGLGIILSYVHFEDGLEVASVAVMAIMALVSATSLIIALRQNHTNKAAIKAIAIEKIATPQLIITLITCAVFAFIFSTHRIMHWDDLSYWGIYTKNLLCLNRIPYGVENCSISYKDYNPIMQIMEYVFMFTAGAIKEEQMFQVNVCFMYVLMIPFLNGLRFTTHGGDWIRVNQRKSQKEDTSRSVNSANRGGFILRNTCIIVMYVIFPHLFSTQFYYKLGVDYLMGLLFGYGIYLICAETVGGTEFINLTDSKPDSGCSGRFRLPTYLPQLLALIIASSFLTMMKTSGVILSIFLTVFWVVRRLTVSAAPTKTDISAAPSMNNAAPSAGVATDAIDSTITSINAGEAAMLKSAPKIINTIASIVINIAATIIIPMCFWLSWKLWGRRTGNAGYLSDKVTENVKTMAHLFPDYTKEVVVNYIKRVFTYPLTRERIGLTAFMMIVVILAVHAGRRYVCKANQTKILATQPAETGSTSASKAASEAPIFAAMLVGLFIFCLGHLYMYLFVFDDWEAHGLLEYDRYIGQYLAGVFYYYMMNLWDDGQKVLERWKDILNTKKIKCSQNVEADKILLNPALIITIIMIAMLPYPSMKTDLIKSEYNNHYEEVYVPMRQTAIDEWNECGLKEMNLPMDEDHRVMLMANAWTDELQYFTYEMAPCAVTVVENLPALEQGSVSSFCRDLIRARGIEYVYPMNNSQEAYTGDFAQETRELTQDGNPVEPGRVYEVVRDGEDIWLR